jgi:hypothetical protein
MTSGVSTGQFRRTRGPSPPVLMVGAAKSAPSAVRPVATALLALALAAPAAATPPRAGVFVPGRSLGGLSLGMTQAQVRAAWGSGFGDCRGCALPTWYYTYAPFKPQGAGVQFRRGWADAIFTLWRPAGWRTRDGLQLGAREEEVTRRYQTLSRVECGKYSALLLATKASFSVFYTVDGRLWGFGLIRRLVPPCR